MVNSAGISGYSAITLTPPAEMSVIMQSRGKLPVPNWIFATLLHTRRSVFRRLTNIFPHPLVGHPLNEPKAIAVICWNPPSATTCIVAIALCFPLRTQTAQSARRWRAGFRFAGFAAAYEAHLRG